MFDCLPYLILMENKTIMDKKILNLKVKKYNLSSQK